MRQQDSTPIEMGDNGSIPHQPEKRTIKEETLGIHSTSNNKKQSSPLLYSTPTKPTPPPHSPIQQQKDETADLTDELANLKQQAIAAGDFDLVKEIELMQADTTNTVQKNKVNAPPFTNFQQQQSMYHQQQYPTQPYPYQTPYRMNPYQIPYQKQYPTAYMNPYQNPYNNNNQFTNPYQQQQNQQQNRQMMSNIPQNNHQLPDQIKQLLAKNEEENQKLAAEIQDLKKAQQLNSRESPSDSKQQLEKMKYEHLLNLQKSKQEMQLLKQEAKLEKLKNKIEEDRIAQKNSHEQLLWEQEMKRVRTQSQKRQEKARNPSAYGGSGGSGTESDAVTKGISIYFDYLTGITKPQATQVTAVFAVYEKSARKTKFVSLPISYTEPDGVSNLRCLFAIKRRFLTLAPIPGTKIIVESQMVVKPSNNKNEVPITQSIGWSVFEVFTSNSGTLLQGKWKIPMFWPHVAETATPFNIEKIKKKLPFQTLFIRIFTNSDIATNESIRDYPIDPDSTQAEYLLPPGYDHGIPQQKPKINHHYHQNNNNNNNSRLSNRSRSPNSVTTSQVRGGGDSRQSQDNSKMKKIRRKHKAQQDRQIQLQKEKQAKSKLDNQEDDDGDNKTKIKPKKKLGLLSRLLGFGKKKKKEEKKVEDEDELDESPLSISKNGIQRKGKEIDADYADANSDSPSPPPIEVTDVERIDDHGNTTIHKLKYNKSDGVGVVIDGIVEFGSISTGKLKVVVDIYDGDTIVKTQEGTDQHFETSKITMGTKLGSYLWKEMNLFKNLDFSDKCKLIFTIVHYNTSDEGDKDGEGADDDDDDDLFGIPDSIAEKIVAWSSANVFYVSDDKSDNIILNIGSFDLELVAPPIRKDYNSTKLLDEAMATQKSAFNAEETDANSILLGKLNIQIYSGNKVPVVNKPKRRALKRGRNVNVPVEAWMEHTNKVSLSQPFNRKRDAINIYIDKAKFLPNNVTVSKMSVTIYNKRFRPIAKREICYQILDSDSLNPEFDYFREITDSTLNATATMYIRLETIEKHTRKLQLTGLAVINIFNDIKTKVQPEDESA